MKKVLPNTMKVVRMYENGAPLKVDEVEIPKVGNGQVLVKMAASPINPSDLSMLKGTFNVKPSYPFVPGIEGSGVVVAAGKGLIPAIRNGKRVACSPIPNESGTWAEYMLTDATRCVPIPKNVPIEQGAMMIVNPMTAMGFIDAVKQGKHKAFVNNAATSALAQMIGGLAKEEDIPMINIVRRPEQIELLKSRGEQYVLCSSSEQFVEELKELAEQLDATLFFDAIGGKHTKTLIEAAPFGSNIKLYSNLSGEEFCINSRTILQNEITIDGFSLGNFTSTKSILQLLQISKKIGKLMPTIFKSTIRKEFALEEINEAIEFYKSDMSAGKVLLKMR